MKRCGKCGLEKDEVAFSKNALKKDGLQNWCKDCVRSYEQSRKDERHLYNKRYRATHREEISIQKKAYYNSCSKFIESLKRPCVKCGESRHYVIQFHHIKPSDKLFTIGAVEKKKSELIVAEVKKCICLCANCHSEYHWIYGKNPDKPVESLAEYLGTQSNELLGGE